MGEVLRQRDHCQPQADQENPEALKNFWSLSLGVPKEVMAKPADAIQYFFFFFFFFPAGD